MSGRSMFETETDDFVDPDQIGDQDETGEMDAMIDQYLDQMTTTHNEGELISVPVVAIKADHVLADVGEKSEGIIDIREFPVIGEVLGVKVGDTIEVVIKGTDPETGLVNLSHREARRRRAMDSINAAVRDQTAVKGVVTRTVKGGLIVDIGTTAFLPASQVDLRRIENFDEWVGQEVEGLIIEFVPEKRRIVLSRRKLLESAREEQRRAVISQIKKDEKIEAKVKRIVDFGVFVDLGGVDGLIPRSEVSWQRNARAEDFMKVGDTIQAQVIEIQPESGKITLSRRMALPNPWETAAERYPAGTQVTGAVVSITSYGAFVRLDEGLDGMVHVSDMGWDSAGRKPSEYLKEGETVAAQVLSVDTEGKRISLGLKQLSEDPWVAVAERYPKERVVSGTVSGLTKYGAFVELEPGVEGMVHVSDFSWDKRISQPRQAVKKGDTIEAVVLDVDRERRRISLGVKQLSENPIKNFYDTRGVGDVVEGEVVNVTDFGAFIRLAPSIEGFMHVSQFDRERVEDPKEYVKIGEQLTVKITKIDGENGKISLSRRQIIKEQDRRSIASYMKNNDRGSINRMGDLMGEITLLDDLPPGAEPLGKRKEPAGVKARPAAERSRQGVASGKDETTGGAEAGASQAEAVREAHEAGETQETREASSEQSGV